MSDLSANAFSSAVFAARRAHLARTMQHGIAVLPTAPERVRNRDAHYPYRFDSYFYYLTGFPEPDSVLVQTAGPAPRSILFCRPRDPERETWDGFRYGPEGARAKFGFDESYPLAELDERMPQLLADQPALYCHLDDHGGGGAHVRPLAWLDKVRAQARTGVAAPSTIVDVHSLLDEMRLIKDEHEIALMQRAADITARAHERAMLATRPGRAEHEIEAELLHEFRTHGAQAPAYTPIVAGGANACVLHYVSNNAVLRDGDLLLIDAGCEVDGYAADVTRTFPVNGRFSAAQRDVYEIVLAAQASAIGAALPGASWNAPHDAAVRVLAQGFVDLGLCSGPAERVIEAGDYRKYYMHRTGHWLGLDVHDAGEYKCNGEWRKLEPGMVLTVEPGCYIRAGEGVPEHLADIGIRIEDDVMIAPAGNVVLTAAAPKTVDAIEALMRPRG